MEDTKLSELPLHLQNAVPTHKFDYASVDRAIALGYPAIVPILPHLLTWIQDMNWPVAKRIQPFLVTIGTPLIPYLQTIFDTDDTVWQYWVIRELIVDDPDLFQHFKPHLEQLANLNSADEDWQSLSETAQEVLDEHRLAANG